MVRRRKAIVSCALAGCVVLSLSGFVDTSWAQTSSFVFVVYGRMTTLDGNPISGSYTIAVENIRTGATLQDDLGTGADAGKYGVVFLSYSPGGAAAEVGDILEVAVKLIGDSTEHVYCYHEVALEEILGMRVRIDLVENLVPVESRTWGAIKSLYSWK